jgi:hypothetical protein
VSLEGALDISILALGSEEGGLSPLMQDWVGGKRTWAVPGAFIELVQSQRDQIIISVFQEYGIHLDERRVKLLQDHLQEAIEGLVRVEVPGENRTDYWEGEVPTKIRQLVQQKWRNLDPPAVDLLSRGIHQLMFSAEEGLTSSPKTRLPIFFFARTKDLLNRSLEVIADLGRTMIEVGRKVGDLVGAYAEKKLAVWDEMSGMQKAMLGASALAIAVAVVYLGPAAAAAANVPNLIYRGPQVVTVAYFLKNGKEFVKG